MNYFRHVFGVIFISFLVFVLYIKSYSPVFNIEKSIKTNIPRVTIYKYVNNYHNWIEWNPWFQENPDLKISYKENSLEYPTLEWENKNGKGVITTTSSNFQNKIVQEIKIEEIKSMQIVWNIDENNNKLNLRIKGEMTFLTKILSLLSGGIQNLIGPYSLKALKNIDHILQSKLNEHRFKYLGEILLPKEFYLSMSYESTEKEQDSLLKLGSQQLLEYAQNQNIEIAGNIFTVNPVSDSDVKVWLLGLPISEYHNSQDSLIKCNSKNKRKALKGIHYGVYENLDLSWNFLYQEIELFNPKIRFFPMRVNKVGIETTENPLEWKTELFLPYKLE